MWPLRMTNTTALRWLERSRRWLWAMEGPRHLVSASTSYFLLWTAPLRATGQSYGLEGRFVLEDILIISVSWFFNVANQTWAQGLSLVKYCGLLSVLINTYFFLASLHSPAFYRTVYKSTIKSWGVEPGNKATFLSQYYKISLRNEFERVGLSQLQLHYRLQEAKGKYCSVCCLIW